MLQEARTLPEQLAAEETRKSAPQAVEIHRHDRRVAAAGDVLEATMKGHQVAIAREPAFREYAHDVALLKGFAGGAQRLDDGARPGPGVDRQGSHPVQHLPQAETSRPGLENNEADGPLNGREQENPIYVADVVRAD